MRVLWNISASRRMIRDGKFWILQRVLQWLSEGSYGNARLLQVGEVRVNIPQPMWLCEVRGGLLLSYSRQFLSALRVPEGM